MNMYGYGSFYPCFNLCQEDDLLSSIKQEENDNHYQNYDDEQLSQSIKYEEDQMPYLNNNENDLIMALSQILERSPSELYWINENEPVNFQILMIKAKRILRREKAKLRSNQVCTIKEFFPIEEQETPKPAVKGKRGRKSLKQVEKSFVSESSDYDKFDKKKTQMIRNRISAQNSRDRKKAYMHELEMRTFQTQKENQGLKKQVSLLEASNAELQKQNKYINECVKVLMTMCQDNKQLEMFQGLQQEIIQLSNQSAEESETLAYSEPKIRKLIK